MSPCVPYAGDPFAEAQLAGFTGIDPSCFSAEYAISCDAGLAIGLCGTGSGFGVPTCKPTANCDCDNHCFLPTAGQVLGSAGADLGRAAGGLVTGTLKGLLSSPGGLVVVVGAAVIVFLAFRGALGGVPA